jgi:hypothetical protein
LCVLHSKAERVKLSGQSVRLGPRLAKERRIKAQECCPSCLRASVVPVDLVGQDRGTASLFVVKNLLPVNLDLLIACSSSVNWSRRGNRNCLHQHPTMQGKRRGAYRVGRSNSDHHGAAPHQVEVIDQKARQRNKAFVGFEDDLCCSVAS